MVDYFDEDAEYDYESELQRTDDMSYQEYCRENDLPDEDWAKESYVEYLREHHDNNDFDAYNEDDLNDMAEYMWKDL